jgi:hypothetical protein
VGAEGLFEDADVDGAGVLDGALPVCREHRSTIRVSPPRGLRVTAEQLNAERREEAW